MYPTDDLKICIDVLEKKELGYQLAINSIKLCLQELRSELKERD